MISVIIPTYNEKELINSTIENLINNSNLNDFEIIVSDSSPNDDTFNVIVNSKIKYIKSKKGRAVQMNFGVSHAHGDILLFLHVDTLLPSKWDDLIVKSINNGYEYGGFLKQFESGSFLLKVNSWYSNVRLRLFSDLLGDNAIFIQKSVFEKLKGYKKIAIMEDIEISKRLKKFKIKVINSRVITSARRFEKYGILKTLFLMVRLRILYFLRVDPEKIKTYYLY